MKKNISLESNLRQKTGEKIQSSIRRRLVHGFAYHTSEKIKMLRDKWGDRGYGWLFIIREVILSYSNLPYLPASKRTLLYNDLDIAQEQEPNPANIQIFNAFYADLLKLGLLLEIDGAIFSPDDYIKWATRSIVAYQMHIAYYVRKNQPEKVQKLKLEMKKYGRFKEIAKKHRIDTKIIKIKKKQTRVRKRSIKKDE